MTLAAILCTTAVFAQSPAASRAAGSIKVAISSVELLPELRNGPIPKAKEQTALNLLRDLDSAIKRSRGALERLSEADRSDAELQELTKKVEELEAFRTDLKNAMESGAATSAASEAQYRAFKEETKQYAKWVSIFEKGPHGEMATLKEGVAELGKLDQLCRTKYAGLPADDKLSFKLNIDPHGWCSVAARREELLKSSIASAVEQGLDSIVEGVKEARMKLARNNGLVAEDGPAYKLLLDREKGKANLAARLKPAMEAAGKSGPIDFGPLDKELDAFGAEIDRLAPTWGWDAKYSDAAGEAAAKKFFASQYPGRTVVKCGFEFQAATISKNALGVPEERYRTGALLAKGSGKWCEHRSFTTHEAWAGKGWAQPRVTIGAVRFQACR